MPTQDEYARAAVLIDYLQDERLISNSQYEMLDTVIREGMASNSGNYYRIRKYMRELRTEIAHVRTLMRPIPTVLAESSTAELLAWRRATEYSKSPQRIISSS